MTAPLVTILSPCYNAAKWLPVYLNSILGQTYTNMELILVDDGSTDNSRLVIESFAPRLAERSIPLRYVYQENAGQAAALNAGLKLVSGEYLVWPDADDFLMRDSIEKRVRVLEENIDHGWARSNAYVFDECDLERPLHLLERRPAHLRREWLFDDIVSLRFMFCPGCYMVRMTAFDDVNPARELYVGRAGQNIQMMLPIAHKYPCVAIDEPLYGYVIHEDSHSRLQGRPSLEAQHAHQDELERTMVSTLRRVDGAPESAVVRHQAVMRYQRFYSAWMYGNREEIEHQYAILMAQGELNSQVRLMKRLAPSRAMNLFLRLHEGVHRRLVRTDATESTRV